MANQSLSRRQSTEVVVQQHTPGQVVRRAQSQLQEIGGVVTTAAVEYDRTRGALEAVVTQPGRSRGISAMWKNGRLIYSPYTMAQYEKW